MNERDLFSRLRESPAGRVLLALFVVPAILIGLLAMHVLTTGSMNQTGISTAPTASHHVDVAPADMSLLPAPGTPAPAGDCGGPCMPSHDMLSMLCVLALLVGVILFAVRLVLTGWPSVARVPATLHARVSALAPPSPPSLHVLSISRT